MLIQIRLCQFAGIDNGFQMRFDAFQRLTQIIDTLTRFGVRDCGLTQRLHKFVF